MGALTWLVREGRAADIELSGFAVALASWYDDDEPGSPWRIVLYVDETGDDRQREALTEIFLGRLGGNVLQHFPWARKPSELLAVRPARIEVDHTPARQRLRIGGSVDVRIAGVYEGPETVTCVIPGHDRRGRELVTDVLRVADEAPLRFEFSGSCGYAADFDYGSEEGT